MEKYNKLKALIAEDPDSKDQAIDISRDLINLVNRALDSTTNPRLSKAVAIASATYTLGTVGAKLWKLYKKGTAAGTYTIKITEDDAIFDIVEDWLMDALPEEELRSVYATSTIVKGSERPKRGSRGASSETSVPMPMADWELELMGDTSPDPDKSRVRIDQTFDGTIVQDLTIAGHDVQVYTTVPEHTMMTTEGARKSSSSRSMNIVCKTVEARFAVLAEISKESQHLVESQPRMYVSTRWGDWRKKAEIQPRSRDSVILKDGQMDRIVGYLMDFLSHREAYRKADIPFRTGILLYGDPGSGKSSTALAIANELKMNVYIVALSSLSSDESLNDCFSAIPSNSIVILEDIDVASAVKNRDDDDDKGVTMSGMLNVLDGFQSPQGVITIMTTNRKDVLDPAIIRPGRVDLEERLDCLDNNQLKGLCSYFMGYIPENLPNIVPEDGVTSAEIMGVVRKHLPDFENAGEDMVKFITDKVLTKLDV